MDAISLGPFAISGARLQALIAFAAFLISAEAWARLKTARLSAGTFSLSAFSAWAWQSVIVILLAARLAFVMQHLAVYLREPWTIFYIWQGGFAPLWGIAVGLLYSLWHFRKEWSVLTLALLPMALGLGMWLLPNFLQMVTQSSSTSTLPSNLPALTLLKPNGTEVNLADYRGQPVVINLWATWCAPCRREMPLLLDSLIAYPHIHFIFINQGENVPTVQNYMRREGFVLPKLLLDGASQMSRSYRAVGLPTTLFFDAEGNYVEQHMGELSRAMLQYYLKQLE